MGSQIWSSQASSQVMSSQMFVKSCLKSPRFGQVKPQVKSQARVRETPTRCTHVCSHFLNFIFSHIWLGRRHSQPHPSLAGPSAQPASQHCPKPKFVLKCREKSIKKYGCLQLLVGKLACAAIFYSRTLSQAHKYEQVKSGQNSVKSSSQVIKSSGLR